jgi:hypothetical protein
MGFGLFQPVARLTTHSKAACLIAAAAAAASHLQLIQLLLYLGVMFEVAELEAPAAVGAGAALRVALLCIKPAGMTCQRGSACIATAGAENPASAPHLLLVDAAAGRSHSATIFWPPNQTTKHDDNSVCLPAGLH